MTDRNTELFKKFQLFYDNVSSHQAPGHTKYEISVYMTKAYKELVNSMYERFEKEESARKGLAPLVTTKSIEATDPGAEYHIVPDSKFHLMPDDVLYVLYEALAKTPGEGKCETFVAADIYPVTHDEFHSIRRNPFRYNKRRALRLDTSVGEGGSLKVYAEIVAKVEYEKYFMRYLRRPKPIILEALSEQTIDGESVETEPELDIIYDDVIAKAAAVNAYQDYKQ